MMRRGLLFCAVMVFVAVGVAQADSVSFTVDGVGPTNYPGPVTPPANAPWGVDGYPGDTVALGSTVTVPLAEDPTPGVLDLTPGTYVEAINMLYWTIDYTYAGTATDPDDWSDLSFVINANRNITFGTGPGAVTRPLFQTGTLDVTYNDDFLSFGNGSTTSFVVDGFRIDVTPLGLASVGGNNFAGVNPWIQNSRVMWAQFDVTPVPVPPAIGLVGLGMAGLALRRFRRQA